MAEELLAVHETIKELNDDDALELFKKALMSPFSVQLNRSTVVVAGRAMDELRRSSRTRSNSARNWKLISLDLSGKSADFSMVDEMVTLLMEEQGEDDGRKAFCIKGFGHTEDEAKILAHQTCDHREAIADYKDQLSETDARIEAVQKSIPELDASAVANNAAATELLKLAAKRLDKCYAPKKLHRRLSASLKRPFMSLFRRKPLKL